MPLYLYSCPICGIDTEAIRGVAQRYQAPECPACVESGMSGVAMELNPMAPSNFVMDPARSVRKPRNM